MKQVPISKTWAEDTENKIIPTEQETANGIAFQAQIESDVSNGFLNQLYEAVKYVQRSGGYYNSFIPYEINSTVKILRNENGEKSNVELLRIAGNGEANIPPYTGATETDVNGVIEWSGGTLNSGYWKRIDLPITFGLLKRIPQLFSGAFAGKNPIDPNTNTPDTRWQLCDGTNGTPNLVDRFIRGGDGTDTGDTGGASSHTHTVTVANRTLSVGQLASHAHTVKGGSSGSGSPDAFNKQVYYQSNITSSYVGSSSGHNHTASTGSASNLPPYYTLAYIIYIGE